MALIEIRWRKTEAKASVFFSFSLARYKRKKKNRNIKIIDARQLKIPRGCLMQTMLVYMLDSLHSLTGCYIYTIMSLQKMSMKYYNRLVSIDLQYRGASIAKKKEKKKKKSFSLKGRMEILGYAEIHCTDIFNLKYPDNCFRLFIHFK